MIEIEQWFHPSWRPLRVWTRYLLPGRNDRSDGHGANRNEIMSELCAIRRVDRQAGVCFLIVHPCNQSTSSRQQICPQDDRVFIHDHLPLGPGVGRTATFPRWPIVLGQRYTLGIH